jgi:hypothetical protein
LQELSFVFYILYIHFSMFKKVFQTKRKRQEPPGRHNTNKITFDPASAAILNRHFSPLSCRAKSPSDVLDIVGYPLSQTDDYSLIFSPLSPETPFKAIPEQPSYRLTIRNNPTPNQLLETSREDKTLVGKTKKKKYPYKKCF